MCQLILEAEAPHLPCAALHRSTPQASCNKLEQAQNNKIRAHFQCWARLLMFAATNRSKDQGWIIIV
jgi:hypothetical protein